LNVNTQNSAEPTELARAWQRFDCAASVHTAAIQALRLLSALPDPRENIAASLLVRLKADPRYTEELRIEAAEKVLGIIDDEAKRGFLSLRESALVNVCGSFEYLLKAFFVHGALEDEGTASAKIATLRLKINAGDALGVPRPELWFDVADQVLEVLGQGSAMSVRTKKFLVEHTNIPVGLFDRSDLEKVFEQLDARTFNEALLVRNCVVHNGSRYSAALARAQNKTPGAQIDFSVGYVARFIKPIKDIADQLSPLWLAKA
jgi:hypothetical protein